MNTKDFTDNPEVQNIISDLGKFMSEKEFSDILDEEGNQYVDLVQEGGGVLGIALLGYTYVLEQVGIRFSSLAGTSAGAINTLILGAIDTPDKPKSEKILEIIANKNLYDFVDGPFFVKLLLKTIGSGSISKSFIIRLLKKIIKIVWILIWILPVVIYVWITKGLNRGNNFKNWVTEILNENKINIADDLFKRRQRPAGLYIRKGIERSIDDLEPQLKIIAAEITTETRVIFPEMGFLFWNEPGKVNPADYLRASMSIPVFFHPFKVDTGSNVTKDDWIKCAKYRGNVPPVVYFVDGGVLSNFPIDVFHNHKKIPRMPTFGVKLGDDRNKESKISSLTKFLLAIFNSARHVLDYQFLLVNEDYEHLIQKIDIGEHNWLNFSISDEDKLDLFIRGARAADEFLRKFDWNKYKEIREELIHPIKQGV